MAVSRSAWNDGQMEGKGRSGGSDAPGKTVISYCIKGDFFLDFFGKAY